MIRETGQGTKRNLSVFCFALVCYDKHNSMLTSERKKMTNRKLEGKEETINSKQTISFEAWRCLQSLTKTTYSCTEKNATCPTTIHLLPIHPLLHFRSLCRRTINKRNVLATSINSLDVATNCHSWELNIVPLVPNRHFLT